VFETTEERLARARKQSLRTFVQSDGQQWSFLPLDNSQVGGGDDGGIGIDGSSSTAVDAGGSLEPMSTMVESMSQVTSEKGGERGGEDGEGQGNGDSEQMFFKHAPLISRQQQSLLLLALMTDVVRSLLLNVVVLVKHAGAGKTVSVADIYRMLGVGVVQVVGRKAIQRLSLWLQANRRSDVTFRSSNQSLVELSLQRLFAFWPDLQVRLNTAVGKSLTNPKSNNKNPSTAAQSDFVHGSASNSDLPQQYHPAPVHCDCQVALRWLDRTHVSKVFRDPDMFEPNLNLI